jgi:hypothetical protein
MFYAAVISSNEPKALQLTSSTKVYNSRVCISAHIQKVSGFPENNHIQTLHIFFLRFPLVLV